MNSIIGQSSQLGTNVERRREKKGWSRVERRIDHFFWMKGAQLDTGEKELIEKVKQSSKGKRFREWGWMIDGGLLRRSALSLLNQGVGCCRAFMHYVEWKEHAPTRMALVEGSEWLFWRCRLLFR